MSKFSSEQEASIEGKIELYSPLLEKGISREELMRRVETIEDHITQKRLRWYGQHRCELDYLGLEGVTHVEGALAMIFGHQMEINPDHLKIFPVIYGEQGFFIIYIQSRNFCPYLKAFERMGISPQSSVELCKLTLEKPCQVLAEKVDPRISFVRNYSRVRPIAKYCDERLVIRDYALLEKFDCI